MPEPLASYLSELRASRGIGVPETSGYPALKTLLDSVGEQLRPRVQCLIHPANSGAGIPDGGLFTSDQTRAAPEEAPFTGHIPERGVIEVKAVGDDIDQTARSAQVLRYAQRYGQVLVTNYQAFQLVTSENGAAVAFGERYLLAPSVEAFWRLAANPAAAQRDQGERLAEYLKRVMLQPVRLAEPKDLAFFLASYAKEARSRIERHELPSLAGVRTALEEALGIHFEGERGHHFFRSTLVQTLFYGLFSAWVLWSKEQAAQATGQADFDWRLAGWHLKVPAVSALFEEAVKPSSLQPLGLMDVLDWTTAVLNRVDRTAFFARFAENHAVQYFYEPFLKAFDPDLREQLGVWYTPPEVVDYMVERVDTVLRQELNIPDGLADPRVYVLDPCTGTGSYLVATLKKIASTLAEKGDDALLANELKQAAMHRLIGFEILPAPFVVAHLQIGLVLQNAGVPLSASRNERAAVYLTNALTGWASSGQHQAELHFPELIRERDAAEAVKREQPVLVIIGNPPYSGYAGVAVDEERELTDAYRTSARTRQPQGQGLNDLYVRFFRMAERRIVEMTGQGVICLISNYSWLDGLSFSAMRERYLNVFDRIWIDCLNGDRYKTGKVTPDGNPDPSIFSTDQNREGIQVGTAISLLARSERHRPSEAICFRSLWGTTKRGQLLETAQQRNDALYTSVVPEGDLGLPFVPISANRSYFAWPSLPALFPVSFPGVKTSRDDVVTDIDKERLVERMKTYFDPAISHEKMRLISPGAMETTNHFNAEDARKQLQQRGFLEQNVTRYHYRPFDTRWLYWEPAERLLDRPRQDYVRHVSETNLWLEARQRQPTDSFDRGLVTRFLADQQGNGMSSFFPLFLQSAIASSAGLFGESTPGPRANLSAAAQAYLTSTQAEPSTLFFHTIAILHSALYRSLNSDALRQDWPRIPLPASSERLLRSAALGETMARLLDVDTPTRGVTTGAIRVELRSIAAPAREGGTPLDPSAGDLSVTAGWGHGGNGQPTMAGRGKAIERTFTADELLAIRTAVNPLGLPASGDRLPLGESTFDIYLNDYAYWRNVPEAVWEYTLGGYRVLKKWLSYREQSVLGRSLRPEELRLFRDIARRIAAIILLGPELDANYRAVEADAFEWPSVDAAGSLKLWSFDTG